MMGVIDWEQFHSADTNRIANDEDEAEKFYNILLSTDIDEGDTSDSSSMVKLFQVAKAVLNMKGALYDAAMDEMENMVQDKNEEGRNDREAEMLAEIKALHDQVAQYQKYSGSGDTYLHAEIQQLEQRNKLLQQELEEMDKRLLKEQSSYDRVNTEIQVLETRHQKTKKELDIALNDIKDYQRQFQTQRENLIMKRSNADDVRQQMSIKNRELSQYLDEIKNLQNVNDKLQLEVDKAQKEMEQATIEMNGMADDYSKLKTVLEETDTVVEGMRKERELLRSQIQDMEGQLQKKTDGDDDIMLALNKKVTEWKDILAAKDAEISSKSRQVFSLEKQLHAAKMDSDRNAVIELTEANSKKDEKINELKANLELATKDYTDVTDQINTLKTKSKDGAPSIAQQQKINSLNRTLLQEQMNTVKERERIIDVEQDIVDKDRQIAELVNRMLQYEQGQYGLSEAVQEIKDCRSQIRIRDRNIEELAREVNGLHAEMEDITLENEELRERLGISSSQELDVDNIRKKRAVRDEQAQALNRVLQKEIERLEEERVTLKRALRKQALDRGERAVELGLSSVDLEPFDGQEFAASQPRQKIIKYIERPSKNFVDDAKEADDKQEECILQNKKFEEDNKDLKEENRQLELGLREIHGAIKSGAQSVNVPALDKLIAIIEERYATGQYDTNVQLKAQIQHMTGRNEELRFELRNAQSEITKTISELDNRAQIIDDLEKEVVDLREISKGVIKLNPLPLPEGINPTSKDIIACLNEYLIQILQELSNKENLCSQMQIALEEVRKNYSVAMHQQSILYTQFLQLKKEHQEENEKHEQKKQEFLLIKSQNEARLQEFDRLLTNLECEPSQHKKLLVELTRKITVLRVNEKSLTRRYTVLQELEKGLRKRNDKLDSDMLDIEAAVQIKIGDLERHKEASVYKITALHKALEETVPMSEMEITNRQLNELTAKYRDLLQKENTLMARSAIVDNLQAELKAYQHTDNTLKQSLQLEKEKSCVLEQTLNDLVHKLGQDGNGVAQTTAEITSFARKFATLEMKELNERQRANHASVKYEQLRTLVVELENRNSELEQKFAEISKINLDLQRVERDLRDQFSNSVSAEVNRADKALIRKLEEQDGIFRTECHKLKEIADIAQHQTEAVTLKSKCQKKEMESIRRQLSEMQMETDEKTIIAKLHQHIVALQMSEATAVRKLEVCHNKLKKSEASVVRLQHQLDDKNEGIHHLRIESRSKMKFLKVIIQDLRRQFSGALPLGHQERFSETLRTLHQSKVSLEKELFEAKVQRVSAEDTALEFKVKYDGLQELIVTLKDGQGAKKVVEWHERAREIKLEDMKLKREIDRLKEQLLYHEKINTKNDGVITNMEKDVIKQAKEYEDRQLLWEQHEVELERKIVKLERQQQDVFQAARKFEEATGSLPDDSLPVANQLEIAINKIKEHIKIIILARAETNNLKEQHDRMQEKVRAAESSLIHKDKIINELRIRLPFHERNRMTHTEITAQTDVSQHEDSVPQIKQTLKVAQTTIDSLQLMLKKKDESISKYQDLLNRSREELKTQMETHQREMKVLQDRLQLEVEEHVKKIKKMHAQYVNGPQRQLITDKQLKRLSELEEMLDEQDTALGTASSKHHVMLNDMKKLKAEAEGNITSLRQQLQNEIQKHSIEVKTLSKQIDDLNSTVHEKDLEIEILQQGLETAKEDNEKAPSRTMKNLVERLRNQLAKKEKEHKALSQALLQIRSDMVVTAEENVKTYTRKMENEANVQQMIEKETGLLTSQIEEVQERNDKFRKEMKRRKDNEEQLTTNIDALKKDLHRKEGALRELANELKEREDLQERCEKLTNENRKLQQQLKTSKPPRIQANTDGAATTVGDESGTTGGGKVVDMSDLDERPVKEGKNREEIARWDESKKWQKKVETLRGKLKEKTEELQNVDRTNTMLRETVTRQEKDKLTLQNRLKSLGKSSSNIPNNKSLSTRTFNNDELIAGLKDRIFCLEDENNELTRTLQLQRDTEFQELRIELSQKNETIHALEAELSRQQVENDPDAYQWSVQREQKLQKEMLEIRKENMELRFENEQAVNDVPRLKARVADLNSYVEILKSEMENMKKRDKTKKVATETGMGGQSVEDMERVIAAMRRVVERLQTENETLKKQSVKQKPHNELAKENRNLKQELQRLRQVQTNDNKRVVSAPKSTVKLMQENDKLRKDFEKETQSVEKLRIFVKNTQLKNENLIEQLQEKESAIEDLSQRLSVHAKPDGGKSRSLVVNRMYEEKIKSKEEEIQKKNGILKEIKSHLRGSAEREAELLRKNDELEEMVKFLRDFPPVESENQMAKTLQQARLKIRRLEAEKAELTHELERLRALTNDGETPVDVTQDEILDKLRKYDKMLAMEVDLRTKIKTMEIQREKIVSENKKLKKELSSFDPQFFEELEDLKYNYKKSTDKNMNYEKQLRRLAQQFDVSVNISDDNDDDAT